MAIAIAPPAAINPKLIEPFVKSIRSVMSIMLGIETQIAPPYPLVKPIDAYAYSGIISFSGDVVGTVVVRLSEAAAAKLVKAFMGGPVAADSPDFSDAIGELTNMIAGAAKKDLDVTASISVPTVIMGNGHRVMRRNDVACAVIPCSTVAGAFSVEVAIKGK